MKHQSKQKPLTKEEVANIASQAVRIMDMSISGNKEYSRENEARIWSRIAVMACDRGDELLGINTKGSA